MCVSLHRNTSGALGAPFELAWWAASRGDFAQAEEELAAGVATTLSPINDDDRMALRGLAERAEAAGRGALAERARHLEER